MAFLAVSRLSVKRLTGLQNVLFYKSPALPSSSAAIQHSLPLPDETHDEKNARLSRPLSPSLTLYKMELPSIISISHRISGCAMSVYAVAFAAAALSTPYDFDHYMSAIEAMKPGSLTLMSAKFMIAFPFMFHTCNGVRHLVWDTGSVLNKKTLVATGGTVLAATFITTMLAMFM